MRKKLYLLILLILNAKTYNESIKENKNFTYSKKCEQIKNNPSEYLKYLAYDEYDFSYVDIIEDLENFYSDDYDYKIKCIDTDYNYTSEQNINEISFKNKPSFHIENKIRSTILNKILNNYDFYLMFPLEFYDI